MQHPHKASEAPEGEGGGDTVTDDLLLERKAGRGVAVAAHGEGVGLSGAFETSCYSIPAAKQGSLSANGSFVHRTYEREIVKKPPGATSPLHSQKETPTSTASLAQECERGEDKSIRLPEEPGNPKDGSRWDENVKDAPPKPVSNIQRGISRSMVTPAASHVPLSSPAESEGCTSDSDGVRECAEAATHNYGTETEIRDCVEYVKSDAEAVEVVSGEEENGPSRQHEDTKIEDAGGEQKGPGEPAAESADDIHLSASEVLVDEVHARSRRCSVESVEAVGNFAFGDAKPSLRQFAGYLKKKSPTALVGWQTRWFELKDRRLLYYKSEHDKKPLGRLDLDLIKIKVQCLWDPRQFHGGLVGVGSFLEPPVRASWLELVCCGGTSRHHQSKVSISSSDKEVRFRIKPIGSKRVFELEGPYGEVVEWIDCLRESTRTSDLQESEAALVAQQKWFWKIERVSPCAFTDVCCTGDVLLFRTSKLHAKMQRLITRGTYDHVGMVLRNRRGQIYVLECMGDTGVILTPWKAFVENRWYRVYERVVWRRLYWPVSQERLEALLVFLKQVIGKEYKLTLAKLLNRKPYESESERGFFCSELIAGAWRVMGVIPPKAICTLYWPESFSERRESELNLTESCSLSEELKIDFFLSPPSKSKKCLRVLKKKKKTKQNADDLQTLVSTLVGPKASQEVKNVSTGITGVDGKSTLSEGILDVARKFFGSSEEDKIVRPGSQTDACVDSNHDVLHLQRTSSREREGTNQK